MVDRITVYAGQLARETDILSTGQNFMVGLAKFCSAVLGQTTIVNGFATTPTSPASLNVIVGMGEVYQLENLEQSTWSSLPQDLTDTILKQGVVLSNTTLTITPPSTVGFSQVYLVEVQYQDVDSGSTVLPYFNAASPSSPFLGPGNAGTAQNTVRKGVATIQLKAGTAASTGSQLAPSADVGWTGIFTITVAQGQTTVTAGNITQLANAPFLPVTLPNVPNGVQFNKWIYSVDTGTANNVVATPSPAISGYAAGLGLIVKIANNNTGATVLNASGVGNAAVVHSDGSPLGGLELQIGALVGFVYDGSNFQLAWSGRATPVFLGAPRTYFVNSVTGNDSNDGLTSGTAFRTLQKANDTVALFNLNGFNVTVNVADGTYSHTVFSSMSGSGNVNYVGNTTTPANVVITGASLTALQFTHSVGNFSFNGFKIQTTGALVSDSCAGVECIGGGVSVILQNINYGTCNGGQIIASNGAAVQVGPGLTTISGGAPGNSLFPGQFIYCQTGATVTTSFGGPPLTIANAVTFGGSGGGGQAFVSAWLAGIVTPIFGTITGAGNVTGPKYGVHSNAIVNTQGRGGSYLPGSIAGAFDTGGVYI